MTGVCVWQVDGAGKMYGCLAEPQENIAKDGGQ